MKLLLDSCTYTQNMHVASKGLTELPWLALNLICSLNLGLAPPSVYGLAGTQGLYHQNELIILELDNLSHSRLTNTPRIF